jgi:ABC-type dipeptide transport system, periplasmic component
MAMFSSNSRIASKTLLASAIIGALSMSAGASAAERSELTIHPKEFNTFVRNFNPYLGSTYLHTTTDFVYEPLVVFNELQGNEPVFRLATGFDMADDLKSVTFTLRKGVKWSDGEAYTADDVVYSFDLVKANPELDQSGINQWIDDVKKVDDYTIRFELTEANSNVPYEIVKVPVVPEHVWKNIDNPAHIPTRILSGQAPSPLSIPLPRNSIFSAATRIIGIMIISTSIACVCHRLPITISF